MYKKRHGPGFVTIIYNLVLDTANFTIVKLAPTWFLYNTIVSCETSQCYVITSHGLGKIIGAYAPIVLQPIATLQVPPQGIHAPCIERLLPDDRPVRGKRQFSSMALFTRNIHATDTETVADCFKIFDVILIKNNVIGLEVDKVEKLC